MITFGFFLLGLIILLAVGATIMTLMKSIGKPEQPLDQPNTELLVPEPPEPSQHQQISGFDQK